MESIPSSKDTEWIDKRVLELNQKCKIEFILGRQINEINLQLQINCSSSCWRSMVPDPDDIVFVTRMFYEDKFIHQVKLPINSI